MTTDLTDAELMENPDLWPVYPILPVVKRGKNRAEGVMMPGKSVVYLINMYAIKSEESLVASPKETFDNYEAVVAAGWRVD